MIPSIWLTSLFTDTGHDSMYMASVLGTDFLNTLHAPSWVGNNFNRDFIMEESRAGRVVYNRDIGFYEVRTGYCHVEIPDLR